MKSLLERDGIGSNPSLLLHHATRNVAGVPGFPAASSCADPAAWARSALRLDRASARIDLRAYLGPDAAPAAPPIEAALAGRFSSRAYSAQPLTLGEVARFWRWAYPAEAADATPFALPHRQLLAWNGHVTLVRPVMLALRVAGLEPGAYYVDERNLALLRLDVDAAALPSLLETACFQAEFRDAAMLCLMVGALAEAIERYGDRGYRYMLLEDGVQLQRNGIACAALGLAGCVTGSFSQDNWDHWLGLDGFHGSVLNGYALGHNEHSTALARSVALGAQGAAHGN